jgi:ribosomal protein S11
MSEDPKGFVPSSGLGAASADWTFAAHPDEAELNLFRYCGNDPIDFTDPMGLEVGFGESLIPVWGSAHMAYDSYNDGHYATAAFHTVMAVTDVTGVKAIGSILGKTGFKIASKVTERAAIRAAERAAAEKQGGLVIGKMQDLAKTTGWREGDFTLNLPKLPPGSERWAQNARELQYYIDKGKPIRDVSPNQAGGFLDRERALLRANGWKYDPETHLWSPGRS